ncbi:MAG TPA: NAD(P)/FAD-dependent oxidoreductase [Thermomicrobiaceae bacterium]|nr:NAD(P)/FAD-dependent oxidoreductase [Thermomicrobiaceae bacterium]
MTAADYDAIVVGAGHNGLVASSYLANAGMRVLVLERRDFVGGAAITEELWPGYSVPTCSYICYVLQAKVIDDMDLREYGFDVHHLNPGSFTPFPSGRSILSWDDDRQAAEALTPFSARDAEALPRYRELRKRLAAIFYRWFLTPPPSLAEMVEAVRGTEDEPLLERLLFGSVTDLLDEFFESAEVKGALASAWDAGDPDAPGSLLSAIYPAVSNFTPDENAGIVVGGMGGITRAMRRSVEARGVSVRTGVEVERILVEDGRATGVRLASGDEIRSRLILSNADVKRTFLRMVPREALSDDFARRVERLETKAAYYKFHASLNELPDFSAYLGRDHDPRALAQIKICPSLDYYRKAWDDAIHGRITDSPVMAVQIPSVYDRTLVPNGGHVMSIWVQYAPVHPNGGAWTPELTRQAGEMLIDSLARYAPNIRSVMRDWVCFTPADIERRVGMTDGNIRHIDMVAGQLLNRRPLPGWSDYRTPIAGLYLCGADTHPGGEVTGAPGHNAAHVVLRDRVAAPV